MVVALHEAIDVSSLNDRVQRVTFATGGVIDLPKACINIEVGERFKVEIQEAWDSGGAAADCVLAGREFFAHDGFGLWSCGGLLAKLPIQKKHQGVREGFIVLTRSRRRRRGDTA